MDNPMKFHKQEEEEDEISLNNFSSETDEACNSSPPNLHRRSLSPQPPDPDLFFFRSQNLATMSPAEEIISAGRIVPYSRAQILVEATGRQCEPSLPEVKSSGSASTSLRRSNRNLNPTARTDFPAVRRSLSKESFRSEGSRGPKPRRCALIFGVANVPPEMDLRDMRDRQIRRSGRDAGGRVPADRRRSWGDDLLRLMSCRSNASVTVKASIGLFR